MKRILIIAVSVVAVVAVLLGALPTMAAKPQQSGSGKDVITLSNGFPSGPHETLNIHGKKADYQCVECVPCSTCDPPVQCNVVNVPEYGEAKISYVSGRKVKISELTVFDSCAGFDPPGQEDGAEVWLPYQELGYLVYARALGKPAKGNPNDPAYEPRSIIFQNEESDNPTVFSLFGDVTEPGDIPLMLPLGLITKDGAYELMSTDEGNIYLVRFDSEPEGKGRGKTLGKDITDMFMWSGWVFHWSLDLNGDGAVNELDVEYNCWSAYDTNANGIIDYDPDLLAIGDANGDLSINRLDLAYVAPCAYDLDNNGVIDAWDGSYDESDEFENWLEDKIPGNQTESDFYVTLWEHYQTPVWVFTIADLVYSNQVISNQGIKNLQIRFYPVDGTEFTEP